MRLNGLAVLELAVLWKEDWVSDAPPVVEVPANEVSVVLNATSIVDSTTAMRLSSSHSFSLLSSLTAENQLLVDTPVASSTACFPPNIEPIAFLRCARSHLPYSPMPAAAS